PALFLEIMGRHDDWAVVIALVGGGQEINRGEGGLAEWGKALAVIHTQVTETRRGEIHASPHVVDGAMVVAGSSLFPDGIPEVVRVIQDERLHLPVSIRSHRCEVANEWIEAILSGDQDGAQRIVREGTAFPIYLTRSIDEARDWLEKTTRGLR